MVIDWKITKHESLARASIAGGFLQLSILKVEAWAGTGFVIKINGRKMKCRPATMHGAINAVDTMMQGPIGSLLSGMEPADTENPNSNRLHASQR